MLRLLDSATQLRDATGYDFGSNAPSPSYGGAFRRRLETIIE